MQAYPLFQKTMPIENGWCQYIHHLFPPSDSAHLRSILMHLQEGQQPQLNRMKHLTASQLELVILTNLIGLTSITTSAIHEHPRLAKLTHLCRLSASNPGNLPRLYHLIHHYHPDLNDSLTSLLNQLNQWYSYQKAHVSALSQNHQPMILRTEHSKNLPYPHSDNWETIYLIPKQDALEAMISTIIRQLMQNYLHWLPRPYELSEKMSHQFYIDLVGTMILLTHAHKTLSGKPLSMQIFEVETSTINPIESPLTLHLSWTFTQSTYDDSHQKQAPKTKMQTKPVPQKKENKSQQTLKRIWNWLSKLFHKIKNWLTQCFDHYKNRMTHQSSPWAQDSVNPIQRDQNTSPMSDNTSIFAKTTSTPL